MENVDAVFHLAAKLHDTKGTSPEEAYRNINVEGTRLLLHTARYSGVKRFVFFSTINVYGICDSQHCFDEDAHLTPNDGYSRSKVAAETLVLKAGDTAPDNFDVVILRSAAVYGKGMKGNYNTLIRYLTKGGFVMLGKGDNRRTLIFDEDLAQAAVLALEHPNAGGQIYNITDGWTHTFNEIVHAMCEAIGRKPFFIRIPEPLIRGLIRMNHKKNGIRSLNIFCRAAEKQMESLGVSGQKIQTELGFIPEYDLKKGWRAVISEHLRNQ
jgi:UDP-glucose 4-epimerase